MRLGELRRLVCGGRRGDPACCRCSAQRIWKFASHTLPRMASAVACDCCCEWSVAMAELVEEFGDARQQLPFARRQVVQFAGDRFAATQPYISEEASTLGSDVNQMLTTVVRIWNLLREASGQEQIHGAPHGLVANLCLSRQFCARH